MIKQFYFKQFNLTQVEGLQELLCITNNSIKYQSFIYTQLNDQTVLFQTIQFNTSWRASSVAMYYEQFNEISVIYIHTVKWSNSSFSNN